MSKAALRQSERIYNFLLKLYPKNYRYEFEEEMKYVFSESLEDAYSENGEPGIIRLWARIIIDAGKSLVIQHVENLKGSDIMKTKNTDILMQNKVILWIAFATGLLLLVPLLAMQFTSDVNWSPFDFAIAGALLFGTGLMFVLAARRARSIAYRSAVGVAAAAALLLVWVNLAVGIIGNEDNSANGMYMGVLAIGLIGALLARLQPRGMARVLFATAIAQALVPMIALMIGKLQMPSASAEALREVAVAFGANTFFVALWIGSALLFRHAGATDSK